MDNTLTLAVYGDTVILNSETFDFSALSAGDLLPKEAILSEWFSSDIYKDEHGVLHLGLRLPHGANAPYSTRFPSPILVEEDGEVLLPAYNEEQVYD